MSAYPSDMTDREWDLIKDRIPQAKKGGRPRSVDIRSILNAIFYVLDNGIKWRSLPHDYPPLGSVFWYFQTWSQDGTLERIHTKLREKVRIQEGKNPNETVGILDSQSSKTGEEAKKSSTGFDAGKKDKGKEKTSSG
jgi:putative transposase